MIVHRHGQRPLGALLTDDVLVEHFFLDLFGGLDVDLAMAADGLHIVRDDLLTEQEALVADVDARAGDHLAHLILRLAAERATRLVEIILVVGHD